MTDGVAVPEEVLRARAYLSRVAEPPAPALAALVDVLGPVEAAGRVRGGDAGLPAAVLAETAARRGIERSAEDLAAICALGGRLLVPEDPAWPEIALGALSHLGAVGPPTSSRPLDAMTAPLALWVRGPLVLADVPRDAVGVVGARAASDYGLWVARDWGAGLADAGHTVVSGAALGIDGAAHRGALAVDGPTVAVLACGLDRAYPPAHGPLLEHIAARGLVLGEYPPGSTPARHRFLVRNRLVAALSAGTLVVEAAARSGAMRTASVATALGRAVMVVPGPVTSALSVGCHELARTEGVSVVGRVAHVVEEVGRLGVDLATRPWVAPRPTDGLGQEALRVHEALPHHAPRTSARLAQDSGVEPAAVATHLSDLEERGLVTRDGERWRRRTG